MALNQFRSTANGANLKSCGFHIGHADRYIDMYMNNRYLTKPISGCSPCFVCFRLTTLLASPDLLGPTIPGACPHYTRASGDAQARHGPQPIVSCVCHALAAHKLQARAERARCVSPSISPPVTCYSDLTRPGAEQSWSFALLQSR